MGPAERLLDWRQAHIMEGFQWLIVCPDSREFIVLKLLICIGIGGLVEISFILLKEN
jgi:hypothetical protein